MKISALIIVLACMFTACSRQHDTQVAHNPAEHAAATEQKATAELALNGEERWHADEATNENIAQLQQLMQDHLRLPDYNSVEAVSELGSLMQSGFQEVFDECRMKGPEHDMLHVYLMPMLDDVKALNADNLDSAIAARDRLAKRLDLYQTYFK
ncbi:hypothetical protein [Pontibacter burrus]|uniref:DnrO protein n=1 Tax=Pontibacter burrus TaxID=2704466 RepID=A0A6B3M002_9BACT|nr:hypothetical protein [Pontibacter burrus]NEM99104.1 hypothetical protein [Pontibacter burrus]